MKMNVFGYNLKVLTSVGNGIIGSMILFMLYFIWVLPIDFIAQIIFSTVLVLALIYSSIIIKPIKKRRER